MTRLELAEFIIKNWNTKSTIEIAEATGFKIWQITGLAGKLRKVGIPLPRKSIGSWLTPDTINKLKSLYESTK